MSGPVGYAASYRRHLATQVPRAVLEALAAEADPSWSMAEILDAAEAVGVADTLEAMTLEELALGLALPDKGAGAAGARLVGRRTRESRPTEDLLAKAADTPRGVDPRTVTEASPSQRLSPEAAAALILPVVEARGRATMLEIEEATGLGRRKVRFHVGRLVKAGKLVRHGMGRGTYYTLA